MRVAVVFKDRCQPKRCNLECIRFCPPQRTGTEVIWIDEETGKAAISEETCISCGICLPAGVPISTLNGMKPIEEVCEGDRVLTHRGRYRKVTGVMRRPYSGPLYRIWTTGQTDPLEVTEEHPVLAVVRPTYKAGKRPRKERGELRWVRPAELKQGDYTVRPKPHEIVRERWEVPVPVLLHGGRYPVWGEQIVALPLHPNLARLVGYYLAGGSADDRRVVFSFHEKERESLDDVHALVKEFFSLNGKEYQGNGHGRNVRYDSVFLTRVMKSLGDGCDTKRVPAAFMTAPPEARVEIVKGLWRGDGHLEPRRHYFSYSTTSPHLAYQVQELLASLGVVAGMTSGEPEGKLRAYTLVVTAQYADLMATYMGIDFVERRNRTASHYIDDKEFVYMPTRRIEVRPVQGLTVYNLEVEEDQTYVAAGQLVHNCVVKCPFDAIRIIGLPEPLKEDLVHQFGRNAFRLFRLPAPRKDGITGVLGPNGIGKTTALSILSGQLVPNLGHYRRKKPYWDDVLAYYKGTDLHDYLKRLSEGKLRTATKPQYVDKLSKVYKGQVRALLKKVDEAGRVGDVTEALNMSSYLDHDIATLSGGELQKVAIAATMLKDANVYFFDEPSSYLDIYERLRVARAIHELAARKQVVVVEHDLAVLDFLADHVYLLYGSEGAYGIVAQPRPVRTAINVYLHGMLKEENIRFRDRPIAFEVRPPRADWKGETLVTFDGLTKTYDEFTLEVEGGRLRKGEVVGVVGPNATGKTTFVKLLAGVEKPTSGTVEGKWAVSYKPQYLESNYEGTVRELFVNAVGKKAESGYFETEIAEPLKIRTMMERDVSSLSGGELQRVAVGLTLARDADIYLLDEPSAYLDSNQRMETAKTIRRVMEKEGKTGLIVDHDVYFLDLVSDSIMVFGGEPGVRGSGRGPFDMRTGMNEFLRGVGVTFRRDNDTNRPRINKEDSRLDREQKSAGEYYYAVAE